MLKYTVWLLLLGMILTTPVTAQQAPSESSEDEWIQLFNGENLEGWTPKFTGSKLGVNYNNTFRVEDGILKVSYENWETFNGEFGHLFYKNPFSSYRLRVVYRFVEDQAKNGPGWAFRNNGLMIHSQPPEQMRVDQEFPVSLEVQLLGGNGTDERTTANVCTPGTNVVIDGELVTQHCINSSSETYHGDQWVTAEVVVDGTNIKHYINGNLVFDYDDPQLDPNDADAKKILQNEPKILTGGYITIQAESHPTHFKTIEIKPMD